MTHVHFVDGVGLDYPRKPSGSWPQRVLLLDSFLGGTYGEQVARIMAPSPLKKEHQDLILRMDLLHLLLYGLFQKDVLHIEFGTLLEMLPSGLKTVFIHRTIDKHPSETLSIGPDDV